MDKYCRKCKTSKPLEEFNKNSSKSDGLRTTCKSCQSVEHAKWFQRVKHTKKFLKYQARIQAEWAKNNPDKIKAHNRASRNSTKIKDKKCNECGSTSNLHMHHPDYRKPLLVITLCHDCHVDIHKKVTA